MISDDLGEVTTFYSYKGGTGRSMALANVACILARSGVGQVLMIDWDLEAPGLHRFFRQRIIDGINPIDSHALDNKLGLIELFIDLKNYLNKSKLETKEDITIALDEFDFDRYILKTDIPSLYLIKSGRSDQEYPIKVNSFNWEGFYNQFPDIFMILALYLSKSYRHILIDSRTGITDISGITTMLMPNKLIAVFTPNRQSLSGVLNIVTEAIDYRRQSNDPRPIIAFPLPSRIEVSEPDLRKKWRYGDPEQDILGYQVEFENLFKKGYDLANCSLEEYFDEIQIQHVPRYSYGEEIAVLDEASQDRLSLSKSYENFAKKFAELNAPWIKFRDIPISIPPHQIPPAPRDFKGRENEINDILSNFEKGVTITGLRGMGGVGKTALALVLADKIKSQFPDGQIFVDMRGTSSNPALPPLTPEEAMAQVIRAYKIEDRLPENSNELRGLYHSVLAGKRVLLLLDNAAGREQVETLIPPNGSFLMITSRIKFTLPGLAEKDLDILPPDKACELLLEIAPRIDSRAEELAKRCGYLPIALRNAASAIAEKRDLSVPEYQRRLTDKMALLELVEGSFSLSYDLLTPGRKKQWRRLSVFPEDFDRDAATAVLKMYPDASAEALSDLVRWSLVDFIEIPNCEDRRYRLHDLARLFAESCLNQEELADARYKHANYYSKVLSKAEKFYKKGGMNVLEGLKLLDREWANIKIGQAWAKSIISISSKLKKNDRKSFLQLASSYAVDGDNVLDLRLHPRDKIGWLETGLKAAKMIGDRSAESAHLSNLGSAYADLGETRKAIGHMERAMNILRRIGDRWGEGNTLDNLGNAYADLGETRKAIEYHEQALFIAREIGDRRGEGADLGNLGLAYAGLGETRKAIEYYEQALIISREIGDRRGESAHLGNLGNAYAELGETRKAIEYHEQALDISREIGDKSGEGADLGNLGLAYAGLGETRTAIECHEQALAIAREIGDKQNEGEILCNLGKAYLDLNETDRTIEYCTQSLDLARKIEYRQFEAESICTLGRAFTIRGDLSQALDHCDQALKIFKAIEYPKGEAEALFARSLALDRLDRRPEAVACAEEALQIFLKIENHQAEKVRLQLEAWQPSEQEN